MRDKKNFSQGIKAFISIRGKTHEHLTRQFKKYYNETPTEYINNLRLQEAENMLLNSNTTVANICYRVGFGDLSYFIKLFKEKYSVSPQ